LKKKALDDHKKSGKKFITPFNDGFNLKAVNYESETIPQVIWLAIVLEDLGDRIGIEFLNEMAKLVNTDNSDKIEMHTMLMLSNYELLSMKDKDKTIEKWMKNGILSQLQTSLSQFLNLYPMSPISFISTAESTHDLERFKSILDKLLDRVSRLSTMTQAVIIYNQFTCGRLTVDPSTSLAKFPEVKDYPKTEISKQIASNIRASIKTYHHIGLLNLNSNWSDTFWNQSYKIEPWIM